MPMYASGTMRPCWWQNNNNGSTGRNTMRLFTSALALAGLLLGVQPGLAQTSEVPPSGSDEAIAYLNGLSPEERMEVMERDARREGKVVVYGALGMDLADGVLQPFRDKYPDITVDFVRLRESELVERIALEARAQRVNGDVAI